MSQNAKPPKPVLLARLGEADIEIPQGHRDNLDERQKLIDEGKASFVDWEIAKQQIRRTIQG